MLLEEARLHVCVVERIIGGEDTDCWKEHYEKSENIIRFENFTESVHGHSRAR